MQIDLHKRELPVGPPLEHKVSREEFLEKAEKAGLRLTIAQRAARVRRADRLRGASLARAL